MLKFSILPLAAILSTSAAADPASSAAASTTQPSSPSQARVTQTSFESLDRNADHQISRTEAGVDRRLGDDFAYIDTDGDGYISPAEYEAHNRG
jgi:hypothetical protein